MELDLSALTVAQLETMRDNLIAAHARALNAEAYAIGTRSLERPSAESVLKQLNAISAELARRDDLAGGFISVEFGEP